MDCGCTDGPCWSINDGVLELEIWGLTHRPWPDRSPGVGGTLARFMHCFYGEMQMVNHRPPEWTVGHPTVRGWQMWVAPTTLICAFWFVLAYTLRLFKTSKLTRIFVERYGGHFDKLGQYGKSADLRLIMNYL
uniref:Uncharacterized protein n=1 Tax=Solanum tuberosum TaxID=4113 RepID=M1DTL9_SOLTU